MKRRAFLKTTAAAAGLAGGVSTLPGAPAGLMNHAASRKQIPISSKMKLLRTLFFYAALAGCLSTAALAQITAFSYQGRLTDGGAPANGLYDFTLSAHDALTSGNLVGSALIFADVPVTNGVFVLYPDFGAGVLTGQPRWLEVGVRIGASTGAYTPLNPRQPILATPLANVANTVLSLPAGVVGGAQLAPGSITADKLAPSITTLGLAPSGALLTSFDENATHLTSNGYVKIPGLILIRFQDETKRGRVWAWQDHDGLIHTS